MFDFLCDFQILNSYQASRTCKFMALIMSSALLIQVAGFFFWLPFKSYIYYCAVLSSLLYILLGGIKFNIHLTIFLLILGLNVIILPIDPVFNSKNRFIFFSIILIVCSPIIVSERAITFRQYVFKYSIVGLIALVIGSFFCFWLGVNMMPYSRNELTMSQLGAYEHYETHGGLFSGLFGHSMTLGPFAAFIALFFLVLYLEKSRIIWMLLFLISTATVIISASRAALLALVISIIFLFFNAENILHSLKKIILLSCVGLALLLPIADRVTSGIIYKQKDRLEATDGKLNSREDKFEARLNEFKSSPILGIGFASVDGRFDKYNPLNGSIEPGTSHLAVLSMTGIIGFLSYISILYHAYATTMRKYNAKVLMLQGLLGAYITHMFFEGYIFGSGGFLCVFFWLVISQCFDYKYFEEYEED